MQVLQGEFVLDDSPPPRKPTLASEFPNLAAEWDFERNDDLKPDQVAPFSHRKVWWICSNCGYRWEAYINNRARGTGCPCDAGKILIPGKNDLATVHPELIAEWDYEKNGDLAPDQVFANSGELVWWKCTVYNLSWQSTILNRAQGNGCPFCSGKSLVPGKTDFATLHPELAEEWDYGENGNLTPEQCSEHSNKKVSWICSICGHRWAAIINNRVKGTGCPACSRSILIPGKTDLATLHPEIAKQWDFDKNENLKPNQVTPYSNKRVFWKCSECGQGWSAVIARRTAHNKCPYCSGTRVIPGRTDLATLFPEVAAQWDHERNGELKPSQVSPYSNKSVYWKCPVCNQSWPSIIGNRTKENKCPFCSGHRPIPGKTDLATLFPEIASQWDYDTNGDLHPNQVSPSSHKKVSWKCPICNQSWKAVVCNRTHDKKCPYCSGRYPIPGKTDLATFRPNLAAQWDYEKNGKLQPSQITAHSSKKVAWRCPVCNQGWSAVISSRLDDSSCPFCIGRRPIPGKTDLATVYPDVAARWDYAKNRNLTPEQVTVQSGRWVWMYCPTCGRSTKKRVAEHVRTRGCSRCEKNSSSVRTGI
jgi:rubrerythrin